MGTTKDSIIEWLHREIDKHERELESLKSRLAYWERNTEEANS